MSHDKVKIGAFEIEVPEGHIYLQTSLSPYYDYIPWNVIGDIIQHSALQKAELIDIGANVGDSLAHFRRISSARATCVEPAKNFFAFLTENARQFGDVQLVNKLLSPEHLVGHVEFIVGSQTGGSREAPSGAETWGGDYVTLRDLSQHIIEPIILKSDTDGFDALIVASAIPLIASRQIRVPIIFFEGPSATQIKANDCQPWVDVCIELEKLRYDILILTNIGLPYVFIGESSDVLVSTFAALQTGYARGYALCHYYDILAIDRNLRPHLAMLREPWPDHIFRRQ
jgi:FkbM family methyltransferase